MKKTLFRLVLAAPLFLSLAANAQLKPSHFPQDAEWMVQLDIKALLESPTRKFIEGFLDENAQRSLAAFQVMSGINPTNDLDTVVLFGKGDVQKADGGVLYAYGRFDAKRLTTLAGGAKEFSNVAVGERSLLSWLDNDQRTYACFIDPTMVVMSKNEEQIKQALKAIDGKEASTGGSFAKVLERRKGRFLAAQANKMTQLSSAAPQLAMLGDAEALQLELAQLTEGNGLLVSLAVKAANAEKAKELFQTALGLKALVSMQAQQNPEVAQFAQNLDITSQDAFVTVNLKLPEALLRQTIEARVGTPAAKPAAGQEKPARPDF